MKLRSLLLVLLTVVPMISGCVLAPVLEGVSELGVTPSDRQRLLAESIRDYSDHMRWGDVTRASLFMTPELRGPFVRSMGDVGKSARVVEGRVDSVEFDKESENATALLVLRMYREPYFVVQDYKESQNWKFVGNGEWQMTERTVLKR